MAASTMRESGHLRSRCEVAASPLLRPPDQAPRRGWRSPGADAAGWTARSLSSRGRPNPHDCKGDGRVASTVARRATAPPRTHSSRLGRPDDHVARIASGGPCPLDSSRLGSISGRMQTRARSAPVEGSASQIGQRLLGQHIRANGLELAQLAWRERRSKRLSPECPRPMSQERASRAVRSARSVSTASLPGVHAAPTSRRRSFLPCLTSRAPTLIKIGLGPRERLVDAHPRANTTIRALTRRLANCPRAGA